MTRQGAETTRWKTKMLPPPGSENGNRRILYNSKTPSLKLSLKKIAKYITQNHDFVVDQSRENIVRKFMKMLANFGKH